MDYDKIATDALEARMKLVGELRTVADDASLTDAAKQERSERLEADIVRLEGEARAAVEAGEKDSEIRSLSDRAAALRGATDGERRDAGSTVTLGEELRQVVLGERREVEIDLRAAGANTAITTDAAWAGNTKGKTFATEVLESMRDRSQIFQYARIVTTASGEQIQWPLKNARPSAAVVAEGAAYGKSKGGFTTFTLGATKYGVIVEGTAEMLNDSLLGLESILAQDAGEAVADKVAADAVANLLANVPVYNGAGAALAPDDIIKIQHAVISAYRRKGVYLLNDATLATVRTFKDTTNQYLWQPSVQAGQPDLLAGKPVLTEVNMPLAAAGDGSKKVLLFGDLSKFIIRQVAGLKVTRSDEYGFDSDIVAWKVNWRGDFGLSDTAAIRAHGDAA